MFPDRLRERERERERQRERDRDRDRDTQRQGQRQGQTDRQTERWVWSVDRWRYRVERSAASVLSGESLMCLHLHAGRLRLRRGHSLSGSLDNLLAHGLPARELELFYSTEQ